MSADMIEINLVSNIGNGSTGTIEVAEGTTLRDLVNRKIGVQSELADFTVTLNENPVVLNGPGQDGAVPLNDGDSVVIAPKNVKGA